MPKVKMLLIVINKKRAKLIAEILFVPLVVKVRFETLVIGEVKRVIERAGESIAALISPKVKNILTIKSNSRPAWAEVYQILSLKVD